MSLQYKGAVFFDYDGTLTDEKDGVFFPSKKTVEAIKKLNENGYLTVLATGRTLAYAPIHTADFGGVITSNGAFAKVGDEEIYKLYMERGLLLKIISELDSLGLYYAIEDEDCSYAKDLYNKDFKNMLDNFSIPLSIYKPLDKDKIPDGVKLIFPYKDADQLLYLKNKYKDELTFVKHRKINSCDCNAIGNDKVTGVKKIVEKFGIKRENVYAFGDGTNDFHMMEYAKTSVASFYHEPMLDKVSCFVCQKVREEGVYKALKELELI